ncbi:hypothetical protein UlMin_038329, partial [Ulmus minor]
IFFYNVADWKFAAEQFVKLLPDKVFVHCSERNVSMLTLDGVDVMGQRLVEEVLEVIQRKPNLKKISFVAHSVGGLVARYAIGKLYRALKTENVEDSSISGSEEDSRGTIGGLEAMNFVIVATPHLGSRGNRQLRIHLIFRRTGRHLFLINFDEGKPPLLKRMIEDYDDCYFMSTLCTFKRRMLYSNVGYDHVVGWRTSSIRRNFEQPKWEDTVNENYPHVVYEEHCKACDAEESKSTSVDNDNSDKLEGFHSSEALDQHDPAKQYIAHQKIPPEEHTQISQNEHFLTETSYQILRVFFFHQHKNIRIRVPH